MSSAKPNMGSSVDNKLAQGWGFAECNMGKRLECVL